MLILHTALVQHYRKEAIVVETIQSYWSRRYFTKATKARWAISRRATNELILAEYRAGGLR